MPLRPFALLTMAVIFHVMTLIKSEETQKNDTNEEFAADYLLYLLAAASEAASAEFHAEIREAGLRVPEWHFLLGFTIIMAGWSQSWPEYL